MIISHKMSYIIIWVQKMSFLLLLSKQRRPKESKSEISAKTQVAEGKTPSLFVFIFGSFN